MFELKGLEEGVGLGHTIASWLLTSTSLNYITNYPFQTDAICLFDFLGKRQHMPIEVQ